MDDMILLNSDVQSNLYCQRKQRDCVVVFIAGPNQRTTCSNWVALTCDVLRETLMVSAETSGPFLVSVMQLMVTMHCYRSSLDKTSKSGKGTISGFPYRTSCHVFDRLGGASSAISTVA